MERGELKNTALDLLKNDTKDDSLIEKLNQCIDELEMLYHLTNEENNLILSLKEKLERITLNDHAHKLLETLKNTSENALVNNYIRDNLNRYIRMLEILENPTKEELDLLSSLREQLKIDKDRPWNEEHRLNRGLDI